MPSRIRKNLRISREWASGTENVPTLPLSTPVLPRDTNSRDQLRIRSDRRELVMTRESVRNLAHELRSPLTAIKSSLQLVAAGEAGPVTGDQEHFLALAMRNLDRLDRMTTDLLNKERGRSGMALRPCKVDLGLLLRQGVQMHAVAAQKAGLDFDGSGLPSHYLAEVDADRVLQIVDNLLGNALKFTNSPGLVHVWLDQNANVPGEFAQDLAARYLLPLDMFTLVVQDSGRGMAPDQQARLFEAFARVHDEHQLDVPGSGLGLHITRDLVGAMGGTLSLASRPGQGTTLWVRLPRDEMTRRCLLNLQSFTAEVQTMGPLQVSILDLRERSRVPAGQSLAAFVADMNEQGVGVGTELVTGLWVAAIRVPQAWSRAWSRFAFRAGSGAPETPWRKLGPERVLKPRKIAELV